MTGTAEKDRWRSHQEEFSQVCDRILAGEAIRTIVLDVLPGGGKSLIPVIAAAKLLGPVADAIRWFVPRRNLAEQAERAFLDPFGRRMLGHSLEIRRTTNDVDPRRGTAGYVTTYQAEAELPGLHRQEARRCRYITVLDEPQHVWEDGPWHQGLKQAVELDRLIILMSGTPYRHDGKRVAFMPYRAVAGGLTIDQDAPGIPYIRYGRRDALLEYAIKPIEFRYVDAAGHWLDEFGQRQTAKSLEVGGRDLLHTALETSFALEVLDRVVAEWQGYQTRNALAKLLVVMHRQQRVRDIERHLMACGGLKAISDDSDGAEEAIRRFKLQNGLPRAASNLGTVGMAYEGLDVPAISHILGLTTFRSRWWIEQMLGRGSRVLRGPLAPPVAEQWCMAVVPSDPAMIAICEGIFLEQQIVLRERDKRPPEPGVGPGVGPDPGADSRSAPSILPLGSRMTQQFASDPHSGEALTATETRVMVETIAEYRINHITPVQLFRVVNSATDRLHADVLSEDAPNDGGDAVGPEETVSQREDRLRKEIEKYQRRWAAAHGQPFDYLNRVMILHFGRGRDLMREDELIRVWAWINDRYPIE